MGARTVEGIAHAIVSFVNAEIMAPGHQVRPDDALGPRASIRWRC
jgi:hypothetical protein